MQEELDEALHDEYRTKRKSHNITFAALGMNARLACDIEVRLSSILILLSSSSPLCGLVPLLLILLGRGKL